MQLLNKHIYFAVCILLYVSAQSIGSSYSTLISIHFPKAHERKAMEKPEFQYG